MPKLNCAECKASGKLFADPSDGKSYCHQCWVNFYRSPPPAPPASGKSGGMFVFAAVQASFVDKEGEEASQETKSQFWVKSSKKGNIPVTIEKRSNGKKVTVVSNVRGDCEALISALKKAVGCGGVVHGDTVEIQGEKVNQVSAWLTKSGCLKGVSKQVKEQYAPKPKKALAGAKTSATSTKPAIPPELPSNPQAASIAIKKMKPTDMKKILSSRGFSTHGTKIELQQKLIALHAEIVKC